VLYSDGGWASSAPALAQAVEDLAPEELIAEVVWLTSIARAAPQRSDRERPADATGRISSGVDASGACALHVSAPNTFEPVLFYGVTSIALLRARRGECSDAAGRNGIRSAVVEDRSEPL
jgi:hypothetical protein